MFEDAFLKNEEATVKAARVLAPKLRSGDVVLLHGSVGAGKTTFARALIRALPREDGSLDLDELVPSPTYTFVQTYSRALGTVGHFDLYRLNNPEEIWDLGLEEVLETGIALVEWAEKLAHFMPPKAISLTLEDQGTGRRLTICDRRYQAV